mmetsp:Transcript_77979/g.130963  ORF Transcript_77979/g.130963 Transcript_77979/m.130963 type:complete len:240 (-) Transcript_77979:12-731(-)
MGVHLQQAEHHRRGRGLHLLAPGLHAFRRGGRPRVGVHHHHRDPQLPPGLRLLPRVRLRTGHHPPLLLLRQAAQQRDARQTVLLLEGARGHPQQVQHGQGPWQGRARGRRRGCRREASGRGRAQKRPRPRRAAPNPGRPRAPLRARRGRCPAPHRPGQEGPRRLAAESGRGAGGRGLPRVAGGAVGVATPADRRRGGPVGRYGEAFGAAAVDRYVQVREPSQSGQPERLPTVVVFRGVS